jgi:hypothetical protein
MSPDAPGIANPYAKRVFGFALILGPLLLLASTIAYVTAGDGINDGVAGGTIGVWSCFVLAIAFVGMSRILDGVNRRGAAWLMAVALIGFTAGVAFNVQAIFIATYPEVVGDMVSGFALLAFLPWGWFAPLTFVMSGVLLARSGVVSWRTGIMFIVAGVLFVTARPARIDVVAVMGDVVLVLAMVPLGLSLLTASSGQANSVPADVEVGSSHA